MKLILNCMKDSFKFENKVISLSNQIIIGRQVDGNSTRENGMFECRVLSKNHALIWMTDNKVYIKDTNSSNGTFINDRRINQESDSQIEIFKGTILQFGVSVTTPDGVFYPCVICRVDFSDEMAFPDISNTRIAELESLVEEVATENDKVDRQLELLESNLSVWEDSIRFNLKGKLRVNDLVSRISYLHERLSYVCSGETNGLDNETILDISEKKDSLYKTELESLVRSNDNLQTEIDENEERITDYIRQVEQVETINIELRKEVLKSALMISKLTEEKAEIKKQLENSEEIINELSSSVPPKFKTMNDLTSFDQSPSESSDGVDLQGLLDVERSYSKSLSEQIAQLAEAISVANARTSQLSSHCYDSHSKVVKSRSVSHVGLQCEEPPRSKNLFLISVIMLLLLLMYNLLY